MVFRFTNTDKVQKTYKCKTRLNKMEGNRMKNEKKELVKKFKEVDRKSVV